MLKKTALVTGASGFIGSRLIETLSEEGFHVRALMRKTSSSANLGHQKYERVEGDLRDRNSLMTAVEGVDHVFHLAGTIAAKSREEFFRHNSEGTANLADAVAARNPGISRFVYVSSLAAGGPVLANRPRTEADGDQPISAYGESKLQGEKEVLRHKGKFPISIIRPPIVYGPRDKGIFVFIQLVARNFMPLLRGATDDGHKYYSAIHVDDLCHGMLLAAKASADRQPSGEVFYLSGDGVFSYEEMLKTIARELNRKPFTLRVSPPVLKAAAMAMHFAGQVTGRSFPLNMDKVKELLPDYWICSNEKAKSVLEFAPQYDLAKGMSHAIEWYKREKWI